MKIGFKKSHSFCIFLAMTSCKQRNFNHNSTVLMSNNGSEIELGEADASNSCFFKNDNLSVAVTFYSDHTTPKLLTVVEKSISESEVSKSRRFNLTQSKNKDASGDSLLIPVEKTGLNYSIRIKKSPTENASQKWIVFQNDSVFADGTGTFFTAKPTGKWVLPLNCGQLLKNSFATTSTVNEKSIYKSQIESSLKNLSLNKNDKQCVKATDGSEQCYSSKIEPLSDAKFDDFYKKMVVTTLNPEWKCPLKREQLSYMWVSHFNLTGQSVVGEIIVASDVTENINKVFGKIFTEKYPIERMHPQDYYDGIDAKSMAANNTSGFRCSKEDQGGEHPNGHAIDINPLINPFIKPNEKKFEPVRGFEFPAPVSLVEAQKRYLIDPVEGWNYAFRANRNQLREKNGKNIEQMLFEDSAPTKAFESIGWFWGGKWNCCDDYQHFSINDM